MKILLGIDDSVYSQAAVEFLRKMTWPKETKVVVVSVLQSMAAAYSEVYVPVALPAEALEEERRVHQELVSDAERLLLGDNLATTSKVLEGDPRVVLVDEARNTKADLLVVGSHGRTGLAKLLMGSVAQHVVTHAPCSVLVVKQDKR
jgi:nucleotide-binding universal stress UspA family protein